MMSKFIIFQFIRYSAVAITSTFLGWVVFNALIFLTDTAQGLIINLFTVAAFVISRVYSFFWTKFWIFKHHTTGNIKQECIKFFGISGILTLVNLLIIHIGVNVIGPSFGINPVVWANIFFFLTIPVSLFGNFFGYKFLVFR
mgnify:CR=1 FL=1